MAIDLNEFGLKARHMFHNPNVTDLSALQAKAERSKGANYVIHFHPVGAPHEGCRHILYEKGELISNE